MSTGALEPVLELEAVEVPAPGAPDRALVRGVDWRVMDGERWWVLGAARSGKSSLVGVAAGLIRPVAGRHRLFGKDLASLRESERMACRRRVGVVFGGGGRLFPTMTVLQNLALPLRYHGRVMGKAEADRVGRLLLGLELERYARWWPGDLPRWVAQRVALARALVLMPTVLLLDEPTLGLALDEVGWWRELLGGRMGVVVGPELTPSTWVVATSERRDWAGWAGRTAWLEGGCWRVEGVGAELRPAVGA